MSIAVLHVGAALGKTPPCRYLYQLANLRIMTGKVWYLCRDICPHSTVKTYGPCLQQEAAELKQSLPSHGDPCWEATVPCNTGTCLPGPGLPDLTAASIHGSL